MIRYTQNNNNIVQYGVLINMYYRYVLLLLLWLIQSICIFPKQHQVTELPLFIEAYLQIISSSLFDRCFCVNKTQLK